MNDSESIIYESKAHTSLHPSYFSTVAHFLGCTPEPMQTASILELGCSTGANLIPIAVDHPGARCLGIDLSEEAVRRGNRSIADLGISNVELRAQDLTETESQLGEFDFIVAHGLYSWVPPEVRENIWRICAGSLAPNGVMYISYHIYPGWNFKECARNMMRYMTKDESDTAKQIEQGRSFMNFMAKVSGGYQNHYGQYIRESAKYINDIEDQHFFWDYVLPYNTPVYFHQFMEEAAGHGLGYISDSNISRGVIENFPPEVSSLLKTMSGDLIRTEQVIDFLRNGEMRRSLLCRTENTPDRQIDPARLKSYYMLSVLEPVNGADDPLQNTMMHFKDGRGRNISIDNPLTKAALLEMPASWPVALSFAELLEKAIARLGWAGEQAPLSRDSTWWEDAVANDLAGLYLGGALNFRRDAVNAVGAVSVRPVASPFARTQAAHQNRVANQHHKSTPLDQTERQILGLMDGTRTLAELAAALPHLSPGQIEDTLNKFVTSALLVA